MIGLLINSIAALLLILALSLVALLVLTARKQAKRQRPGRIYQASVPAPTSNPDFKMLLNLVNGDTKAADRLMRLAKVQNPGRSDAWCLEKVIFDLERDRQ